MGFILQPSIWPMELESGNASDKVIISLVHLRCLFIVLIN